MLDAEGGSIHSQVLHLDVILGWQPFHFRRLDDLIQHGGLQTPWLNWLFRLVRNASRRPESWAGKPLVLSLPARLLIDAGSFAQVTAELDVLTEGGVRLQPMLVEQDYLLYSAGLLQPLQALRERGYPLVLDGARHVLALEYLPALMLFDEVRLHPACRRHAAKPGSTEESKLLGLLHQNGLALTLRTPFAWITQRPDSEFRPGLLTGNHSLKTAIALK